MHWKILSHHKTAFLSLSSLGTTSADESVSTPSSQAGNGSDIKDILQYYKDNKLDSHAKEVCHWVIFINTLFRYDY